MLDALWLIIFNLFFIYFVIHFMEKRIKLKMEKELGAREQDFYRVFEQLQNFEFEQIPRSKSKDKTVYNELLLVTHSFYDTYLSMMENKKQIVGLTEKNNELIQSCVKVLNLMKQQAHSGAQTDLQSHLDQAIRDVSD